MNKLFFYLITDAIEGATLNRMHKNFSIPPITKLKDGENGRCKILLQHTAQNNCGRRWYQCTFIVTEGNVVQWVDEETSFTQYNNLNLN